MSESTTEECFTFEFENVRPKVKVELDKSVEKQKKTPHDLQEKVEQDTNSPLKIEIYDPLQTQTPSIDEEMDIKFEGCSLDHTMALGACGEGDRNSETDMIPDWKLNKNVECRVTLVKMAPNSPLSRVSTAQFQTAVIGSEDICISEFDKVGSKVMVELHKSGEEQEHTLQGREEDQEQPDQNSVMEQEIQEHLQIETPSMDAEMDIKYEETGYEHNWALNGEDDLDPDDESSKMNLKDEMPDADDKNSEQIDLDQFYADLLQCDQDCRTCQKYIRKLMRHVRCTHTTAQPASGPRQIDLVESGQFSFVERKREEDKDIENTDSFEEIQSDPDFEIEGDSETDPDYSPSPYLTRNALRQSVVKDHGSTDLRISNRGTSKLRANIRAGDKQFVGLEKRKTEKRETHSSKSNSSALSRITLKTNLYASNHLHTVEGGRSDSENQSGGNMKPCKSKDFNNSRSKSTAQKKQSFSSKRRFKCSDCRKSFKKQSLLTIHMRSHTGGKLFNCNKSGLPFSQKVTLRTNTTGHTGSKPFKCETCHKTFARKHILTLHMRIHTGVKPFKCETCLKTFARKDMLTVHMRIHTGHKPFKCETCDKNFARRDKLTLHMRKHLGDKPFICVVCDRNFGREDTLTLHMRIHTGDKKFKCEVCDKNFGRQDILVRHVRIHTGEQSFNCETYDKNFGRKDRLITHMRIHTGDTPFKCTVCEKCFPQKFGLDSHMTCHMDDKPFHCEECSKSFKRKHSLKWHMRSHTGDKPLNSQVTSSSRLSRQ